VIEDSRPVTGFTSIALHTQGEVTIVQGDAETLTIETDDNLVEYLETTVVDGVLDIRLRAGADVDLEPTSGIKFDITVVTLRAVDLHGAGTFAIGELATDRFSLNLRGVGSISIANLETSELDVLLAGVGSVVLAGEVGSERLTLAGTGDIDASALYAQQATVEMSGIGDVEVWAIDRLDTTITGIGEVVYYGNPSSTQSVTGSGRVRYLGDK
jgi:hypothetical protein